MPINCSVQTVLHAGRDAISRNWFSAACTVLTWFQRGDQKGEESYCSRVHYLESYHHTIIIFFFCTKPCGLSSLVLGSTKKCKHRYDTDDNSNRCMGGEEGRRGGFSKPGGRGQVEATEGGYEKMQTGLSSNECCSLFSTYVQCVLCTASEIYKNNTRPRRTILIIYRIAYQNTLPKWKTTYWHRLQPCYCYSSKLQVRFPNYCFVFTTVCLLLDTLSWF